MHRRPCYHLSGAVLVLVCLLGALSFGGAIAPAEAVEDDECQIVIVQLMMD